MVSHLQASALLHVAYAGKSHHAALIQESLEGSLLLRRDLCQEARGRFAEEQGCGQRVILRQIVRRRPGLVASPRACTVARAGAKFTCGTPVRGNCGSKGARSSSMA